MSDAFYQKLAVTASRLLSKFGQTVTITRETDKVIDPVTGAITIGSTETFSPKGILKKYESKAIDGTLIKAGDKLLVIDDTEQPLLSDKMTVNGKSWNVISVDQAQPAGIPLVYFVQLRS